MSATGADSTDIFVRARGALLDALEALQDQRDALILIGAQAVYLRTGDLDVALAPATKDSDFSLDPRRLRDAPLVEEAMRRAGFLPGVRPGSRLRRDGIPVDLMVPELLAGSGRRSVQMPPASQALSSKGAGD